MPLLALHPGAILSVLVFGSLISWIVWRWSKTSADAPAVLIVKILISLVLIGLAVFAIAFVHPVIGVPVGAVFGIILGLLWARNIGLAIASPLANLYDGGTEAEPPKPFYAIAEAHRKQARYDEAIAEIEKQLELFPGDVKGHLMLAEIRCRHLKDWGGAELAIEEIVANEELAISTRAKALQALADWNLDLRHDAPAARVLLERVISLFPNTPESNEAAQRLAHVGDASWRREQHSPARLHVPVADQRLGLRLHPEPPPPEPDPEIEAEALRRQLSAHPLDTEAREKLALLYADRMGRLDWALGEFDKLLAQPNQAPKAMAKWLHLLADVQIRVAGDESAARAALLKVGQLFPDTALEANAKSRLERIKLEMRAKQKTAWVGEGYLPRS